MQYSQNKKQLNNNKQSGAALFVALIMLLALTIIGLSASQRSSLQERMASNMHLDNMTFNASESAIAAFLEEANRGNPNNDPSHILNKVLLKQAYDKQYDQNGARVAAGFLDQNLDGGSLVASVNATVVDECMPACPGFSMNSKTSCRIYLLEGQGELSKSGASIKTSNTSLFVKQVTACL